MYQCCIVYKDDIFLKKKKARAKSAAHELWLKIIRCDIKNSDLRKKDHRGTRNLVTEKH